MLGESTLSPNEKWIAFVQYHPKKIAQARPAGLSELSAQLHMIPVGGGKAKRLTHSEFRAVNPHWSPDGQKIAFRNIKYESSDGLTSQLCVVSIHDN